MMSRIIGFILVLVVLVALFVLTGGDNRPAGANMPNQSQSSSSSDSDFKNLKIN